MLPVSQGKDRDEGSKISRELSSDVEHSFPLYSVGQSKFQDQLRSKGWGNQLYAFIGRLKGQITKGLDIGGVENLDDFATDIP